MAAPITPDQAVALAQTMIDACDGHTFCTLGQFVTIANLCEHLPLDAAQAVNGFLASVGA